MNIIRWLRRQRLSVRGGIIGAMVCIALFAFYVSIYFPLIQLVYGGMSPTWTLLLPLVTGHFFPLLSGFIVPYGFLCTFTKPICTAWSAIKEPGSVPWTLDTGEVGYCVQQMMTPTDACARLSEVVGFWGLALGLLVIYVVLGAFIGSMIERRRT